MTDGFTGAVAPAVAQFTMDTDNATTDIITVPEPASLAIVRLDLGLLAAVGGRRKKGRSKRAALLCLVPTRSTISAAESPITDLARWPATYAADHPAWGEPRVLASTPCWRF